MAILNKRKRKQTKMRFKNENELLSTWKPILALAIIVSGLIVGIVFTNSAFAGGWEIQSSLSSVNVDGVEASAVGLHEFTLDPDGNIPKHSGETIKTGLTPSEFDDPDITVKTSYPYYLKRLDSGEWVQSDEAVLIDHYTVPSDISNTAEFYSYNHWVIGVDVTIQTNAERYLKPSPLTLWPGYTDYGYYYEANVVDVLVNLNVKIKPWTPAGTDGSYDIVGGWSGIMSASIVSVDYGLVQKSADENAGHTISGLHSPGQALNMYGGTPTDFNDPGQLKDVPSDVDIELKARLGAGGKYTTDLLGHWDSLAVRNVYVTYVVRVDILSALVYSLNLGHQGPIQPPAEDNTAYAPQITPFVELLDALKNVFSSPQMLVILLIILIGASVIFCLLLRK